MLRELPSSSVNLIVTSPPYALHFKKAYDNENKDRYVQWFLPFASEILRVLKDDGSFVLNIGGSYNKGTPTRSIYHFKLLIALIEEIGFHLAQECFWYNPAKMPVPAEWVKPFAGFVCATPLSVSGGSRKHPIRNHRTSTFLRSKART